MALAPWLAAASLLSAWSVEDVVTVSVQVVDAAGVPCPDLAVHELRAPAPEPGLQDEVARFPVVGRVLDETGAPIAETRLRFVVWTHGDRSTSRRIVVCTDAGGRFSVPLLQPASPRGQRFVSIGSARGDAASVARVGRGEAIVEVSAELGLGPHDLGDVVLVVPGSSTHLSTLDDAALSNRYAQCQVLAATNGYHAPLVEHCLLEMSRRASPHWIQFLEQELERVRRATDAAPFLASWGIVHLTALRRAQGKPDPLQIVVQGGRVFDATLPATPVLDLTLENTDVDGASFAVTEGGSYRSGRFARCRLEATDAAGRRLPALPSPSSFGGGMFGTTTLEPGESIPIRLDLGAYVRFPGPGEYEVRVLYHDEHDIADAPHVDGRILAHSAPIIVRLTPWRIRMSRAELEDLLAALFALDTSRPVPLVAETWRPGLAFAGEPTSPADVLFRGGHRAVPLLLDRLQEPDLDVAERGWIFGMLWNTTGLIFPTKGAIGSRLGVQAWPTVAGAGSAESPGERRRAGGVWPSAQRDLAESWSAIRPWIELELTD